MRLRVSPLALEGELVSPEVCENIMAGDQELEAVDVFRRTP